ncbi:ABC transporter permease [Treponema sp. OttesenSCG-928-L16]|nr:ABC transporter permease [Treponema sp. OttesenSCG-928-L16]
MKGASSFFIALRYLLGRAKEGGRYLRGAAAGIAISLVPIMVTLIVADGMIRGITSRYLELGTGHLQVYDLTNASEIEEVRDAIASLDGVRGVWPERQSLGVLLGKHGRTGTTIRAADPPLWEDEGSRSFLLTLEGSSELQSSREVLLGEELARNIGASAGDTIRLMTVRIASDGRNIPRMTPLQVKGIVSSGYRELDSLWCIMDYQLGKDVLSQELSSTFLMVKVDDPYGNIEAQAFRISSMLGKGYGVYTWKSLQRSQYSSYESTRQLLLFIMALIVIVAAVNVSSATSMLVIERRRDIALFKSIGASPRFICRIFLHASFLTGLIGAAAGSVLGLLIGAHINPIIHALESLLGFFSRFFNGGEVKILDPGYYLENIPILIDWFTAALIFIFTVIASILASWIPAHRTGKISPLELMRKY